MEYWATLKAVETELENLGAYQSLPGHPYVSWNSFMSMATSRNQGVQTATHVLILWFADKVMLSNIQKYFLNNCVAMTRGEKYSTIFLTTKVLTPEVK